MLSQVSKSETVIFEIKKDNIKENEDHETISFIINSIEDIRYQTNEFLTNLISQIEPNAYNEENDENDEYSDEDRLKKEGKS